MGLGDRAAPQRNLYLRMPLALTSVLFPMSMRSQAPAPQKCRKIAMRKVEYRVLEAVYKESDANLPIIPRWVFLLFSRMGRDIDLENLSRSVT